MKVDLPYIKSSAQKLIDTYALTIPVHVFQLADLMSIKWKISSTDQLKKIILKKNPEAEKIISSWEDVLGYYNEEIILNNDNSPITRKRFTLAHEIGHVTLHHKMNTLLRRVFMRQDIFMPQDQIEAEANYFAGYLLMPDKAIEDRLQFAVLMTPGEQVIKEFAEMFAVSPDAMRIRFKTFKKEFPDIWKKYKMEERLF